MSKEHEHLLQEGLKALHVAVQDTLETLTYSEAEPMAAGSYSALAAPYYLTSVEVKRPYSGVIRLMISRNLAISLVGAMLGCNGPMDEEWVQDGLSELINTIGGRILAQLVESSSSFDLGIPSTIFVEKPKPQNPQVLIQQAYAVNEGHVELELEFRKAQAA